MLLQMASRNLWRAKRRTLITLFTVAFGVWLAVTFTGTGDYAYTRILDTGARQGFGHVTVQAAGYLDAPGIDKPLVGAVPLADELAARPDITRAVPRIAGQAMFSSATKSVGGVLFAIDPSKERPEENMFLGAIVQGALFDTVDGRGAVVGKVMAEKLDLRLGRRLVYTMVDEHGELVSEVARVSGIFSTGVDDVDGVIALLPLGRVQKLVGYGPEDASYVATFVADHRYAEQTAAALRTSQVPKGREVKTYRETQPEVAGIVSIDRSMNYIFQVLVALLIAAGVLNTILMSVLERRREFGVMMAIGARPVELFGLVVVESFLVGILGLAVGAVLTTPWFIYMQRVGIDFSEAAGGTSAGSVLIDPVMKIALYPSSAIAIAVGVVTLTVLAGLYPAWQAGREPPVETLKAL